MKIKDCRIVSYYLDTDKTLKEVLYQYFQFYVKNKICSMENIDE